MLRVFSKYCGGVCWLVLLTIALGTNFAAAAEPVSARPVSPFETFKYSLKQVSGRFLLNGNWLSEEDLEKIWKRKEAQDNPNSHKSDDLEASTPLKYPHPDLSLNVNLIKGELDYWARSEDRLLSYAIDRSSMTTQEYEIVKEAMAEAASDWENACPQCGIRFEHKGEFDAKPGFTEVRFIVRKKDGSGVFATSFFPSTEPNARYVTVGSAFFQDSEFSRAGTFRHNLGHALGYRHEHISLEAGPDCLAKFREEPTFITGSYDPKSVMHYLCGGGGTKEMRLSERDITSHQLLYGFATVQVDVEGNDILGSVARIMGDVGEVYSRLPIGGQNIDTPDGCRTYLKDLGLLEALAPQNIERGNACSAFASLEKNMNGQRRFPLLPFNRSTDFASGAALNTDREAFREFDRLRNRVNPYNVTTKWLPSGARNDTKIFNYEIEWNRYRANIPVSPLELPPVKAALDALSKDNPSITTSIDDAIGKSLALNRAIKQNAVEVRHPVEGLDAICQPNSNSFGAYPMMLDGNLETADFESMTSDPSKAEIAQLRCDVQPGDEAGCSACGGGNCGSVACRACSSCSKGSAVIIDESIDRKSLSYPANSSGPICGWKPYDPRHHGTLMAQIVAGSNKFLGFMPDLDLKFVPYDANMAPAAFDNDLSNTLRAQGAGVAIVTNQFCYPAELIKIFGHNLSGAGLCSIMGDVKVNAAPGDRLRLLAQHQPTVRIRNARKWLWVTAIGQPVGTERVANPPVPTTFDASSIASPMLLADQSHVMLVSACEKCSVQRTDVENRRNWSGAHRGKDEFRPHVIAPGGVDVREKKSGEWVGGLPGFGVDNEPVRGYGTSQAAAYVGGLATKMLACYPKYYGAASRLKEAIQFTSMPVLPGGGEDDAVATGLVDVRAALRNPGFVYFQNEGEGDKQFARVPRNEFNWCSYRVNFRAASGRTDEIPVEHIRRIVRVPAGATNRWVVYYRKIGEDGSAQDGAIFKSPLYAGVQTPPGGSDAIFSSNGQNRTLLDVQDLLLFDESGAGTCSP